LNVVRQYAISFYNATKNDKGYEGSVILKQDKSGVYCFKQVKGNLNDGRRILVIWRNITDNLDESNAALDAYFQNIRANNSDSEYDLIYVNGDNNLENLRLATEAWKVAIIEKEFLDRMFEE
jgi:adenine-specific DNA-methyltransferase